MIFPKVLKSVTAGLIALAFNIAVAQPIKIVVPFSAGGVADLTARTLEQVLVANTPFKYSIEYKVGAGGAIGASHVAKSRGNETVLMIHSLSLVVNSLSTDASYALTDFEPVATLGSVQLALVTNPKSPVNSMNRLLATTNPVTFGSAGIGSAAHAASDMFAASTGKTVIHVPYKGDSAALIDILSNNINLLFLAVGSVRDQPVTILAVTGTRRHRDLSQTPTLHELGIRGFENSGNWLVLVANTTADPRVLEQIRQALATALTQDPDLFQRAGVDTDRRQLFATRQFLQNEQQRMKKLLEKTK